MGGSAGRRVTAGIGSRTFGILEVGGEIGSRFAGTGYDFGLIGGSAAGNTCSGMWGFVTP